MKTNIKILLIFFICSCSAFWSMNKAYGDPATYIVTICSYKINGVEFDLNIYNDYTAILSDDNTTGLLFYPRFEWTNLVDSSVEFSINDMNNCPKLGHRRGNNTIGLLTQFDPLLIVAGELDVISSTGSFVTNLGAKFLAEEERKAAGLEYAKMCYGYSYTSLNISATYNLYIYPNGEGVIYVTSCYDKSGVANITGHNDCSWRFEDEISSHVTDQKYNPQDPCPKGYAAFDLSGATSNPDSDYIYDDNPIEITAQSEVTDPEIIKNQLGADQSGVIPLPIPPGGGTIPPPGGSECEDIITPAIQEKINMVLNIVKIAVPILLILLGMLDFGVGVLAGNEEDIKKGQQKFVKRCMVAVLIFFTPVLVNLIIWVINQGGMAVEKCGIPASKIIFKI